MTISEPEFRRALADFVAEVDQFGKTERWTLNMFADSIYTNKNCGIHIRLLLCKKRKHDYVVSNILLSEIRHAISSVRNHTAPGLDRNKPKHLKYSSPVFIKKLARLFTHYLSECEVANE
ncbi:hypothetical protein DICVIV_11505 [Dictyocaulus viviparus]|uniref:Uncharacterized protein n=1 Tax=Dictyocaulus viviparus TaxID=29172 RepID=A0A0D8XD24_DICVI|nr:hypothetical protein DICVIV_11505 [Dictyocaulus viviparus]